MDEGFVCINCGKKVNFAAPGTKHRNHCLYCLWSVHLDELTPGDRIAQCWGKMKPVGLSFKNEGGKKQGELEVVVICERCGQVSKNRIAGDDEEKAIISLFKQSLANEEETTQAAKEGIKLLTKEDSRDIMSQLFGKPKAMEKMRELGLD